MARDYERPIIPTDWRDAWFTFARMTIEALDELHEPIKEGDLAKVLQEKIDNGATPAPTPIDTGWVDLKSYKKSNWTINNTSHYLMARRVGDVVHIRINGAAASNITGSGTYVTIAGAIPEDFRPTYAVDCMVPSQQPDPGWVRVTTGGNIQISRNDGGISSGWWVRGDITYTVGGATP